MSGTTGPTLLAFVRGGGRKGVRGLGGGAIPEGG